MDLDSLADRWHEAATTSTPGDLDVVDVHTHTGTNDPDGFSMLAEDLCAALRDAGHSKAAVFSMHEPSGYRDANERVIAAARDSGGLLTPFCRIDPNDDPLDEAARCLELGARGIKLHPRAEHFSLALDSVQPVVALAEEAGVPVLIHAGRGMPELGQATVELAKQHPGANLILAHCGISDLAWLAREAASYRNLFFDTAWWNATDVLALAASVPPGQVLYASDAPYGSPKMAATLTLRCLAALDMKPDQICSIMGVQARRLLEGVEPVPLGPAIGYLGHVRDIHLERVHDYLISAIGAALSGGSPDQWMELAKLACQMPGESPNSQLGAAILKTLTAAEAVLSQSNSGAVLDSGRLNPDFGSAIRLFMVAAAAAITPEAQTPNL